MNGIAAILRRELRSYFVSPLAYVVMTFFLLINGVVFSIIVDYLNRPEATAVGSPLTIFFGQSLFFWLVLLVVCPVLTMRLLSEERKSGTIEVLMTAPVTETQVVVGKFLAAWLFYAALWLPTVVYAGILAHYHEVDWGPVAAGYLGILGLGALFLSLGTFASAVSRNQVVAALFAFTGVFLLWAVTFLDYLVIDPVVKKVISHVNLIDHMAELGSGIVDTRRFVYYLSVTIFFLFLSSRALAANKWR